MAPENAFFLAADVLQSLPCPGIFDISFELNTLKAECFKSVTHHRILRVFVQACTSEVPAQPTPADFGALVMKGDISQAAAAGDLPAGLVDDRKRAAGIG